MRKETKEKTIHTLPCFLLIAIFTTFLLSFENVQAAEIYKYRKPNGKLLFTDQEIFEKGYVLLSPKRRKSKPYDPYKVKAGKPSQFQQYISLASKQFGVEESLIKAIIKTESDFDPNAVSSAGAQGLMQLMPKTARALKVSNSFDAQQNIMGGTELMSHLLHKYNGNLDLALAAYNAGETNVEKHGGIPPFKETKRYIKKVRNFKKQFDS